MMSTRRSTKREKEGRLFSPRERECVCVSLRSPPRVQNPFCRFYFLPRIRLWNRTHGDPRYSSDIARCWRVRQCLPSSRWLRPNLKRAAKSCPSRLPTLPQLLRVRRRCSSRNAPPALPLCHLYQPSSAAAARRATAGRPARNNTGIRAAMTTSAGGLSEPAGLSSTTRIRSSQRPSRSRSRNARTTRKVRRATSARRPSIGRRRRASCAGARAAGRRDSRMCRVWRSR